MLYHLVPGDLWRELRHDEDYAPASLHAEGFVHCSYREQLVPTAQRWFAGRRDVLILVIDPARLSSEVRDEPVRDTRFPHVYGAIDRAAVVKVVALPVGSNGQATLPLDL